MLNGQLKPAYNLQHAVDSEYIVWADISAHPTDTLTLKPFLKDIEENLLYKYREIVADAGYESEENYLYIEKMGSFPTSNRQTMRSQKPGNTRQTLDGMKIWTTIQTETSIPAKTGRNCTSSAQRPTGARADTGAQQRSTGVMDAKDALTRKGASKGTIAKHRWRNAAKSCMYRK